MNTTNTLYRKLFYCWLVFASSSISGSLPMHSVWKWVLFAIGSLGSGVIAGLWARAADDRRRSA